MKKYYFSFIIGAAICALVSGCSNDELDMIQPDGSTSPQTRSLSSQSGNIAYVLSEGIWHANTPSTPGSIIRYVDWVPTDTLTIGDTGNDLIKYGSKLYCAVSGHSLTATDPSELGGIWVLDAKTGEVKSDGMITYDDPKLTGYKAMPRHLAAYDGNIYVSLYSGAVMVIDTISYEMQGSAVLSEMYSEGLCIARNNKLYVCNSGRNGDTQAGSGTTISVLSAKSLTFEKNIPVAMNPKLIAQAPAGDNTIYFNVLGEWGMNSALYKFDPNNTNDTIPVCKKVGGFAIGKDYVYTADVDWYSEDYLTTLQKVDLATGEVSLFADDPGYMFGFSVTVNPFNDQVCFGQTSGNRLYIYNASGGDPIEEVTTNTANVNTVVFVE